MTTIKCAVFLDDKSLVGLCFAMVMSGAWSFEALPTLMKEVPKPRHKTILSMLEHCLGTVNQCPIVPSWICHNYEHLDKNCLPVIEYANMSLDKNSGVMLDMARVCKLPDDLDDLMILAFNLTLSDQPNFIKESLGVFPRQEKVAFEVFGDIIDFITLIQNHDLVTENKAQLLEHPIIKWQDKLHEWRSSGLGGIRHNDPYAVYIKELVE